MLNTFPNLPLTVFLVAFTLWALNGVFYHDRPRPLWWALILAVAGGFLGLLAVPALGPRGRKQLYLLALPVYAEKYIAKDLGLDTMTLFLAWAILDRLLAVQAVLWLWQNDPQRYGMTALEHEAWRKTQEETEKKGDAGQNGA